MEYNRGIKIDKSFFLPVIKRILHDKSVYSAKPMTDADIMSLKALLKQEAFPSKQKEDAKIFEDTLQIIKYVDKCSDDLEKTRYARCLLRRFHEIILLLSSFYKNTPVVCH